MRVLAATLFCAIAVAHAAPTTPDHLFDDPNATRIKLQRRDPQFTNPDGSVNLNLLNEEVQSTRLKYLRNRLNLQAHADGQTIVNATIVKRKPEDDEVYQESLQDYYNFLDEVSAGVQGVPGVVPVPKARSVKKRANTLLYYPSSYVWSALVGIGTPAQNFQLYVDTGSTDVAVPDSTCTTANCGTKLRYDITLSSSAQPTDTEITSSYGDGSKNQGLLCQETMTIAGLTITGQDFIRATSLSSTVLNLPVDGIFGLAYPAVGATGGNSIPFTAYNQGAGQYFALRLSATQGQSELSIGTIDRSRVGGATHSYSVSRDSYNRYTYWQVGLSSPNVNGKPVFGARVSQILDSGSNFIFAPPAGAAQFWAQVPGSAPLANSNTYYTFPCNQMPFVSFTFGRTIGAVWNNYTIAAKDFNLGYISSNPSQCIGSVVSANLGLGTSWLLGSAFSMGFFFFVCLTREKIQFRCLVDGASN
ncbi:acid protease [Meredithblackwellia eburnea MCA 4105]